MEYYSQHNVLHYECYQFQVKIFIPSYLLIFFKVQLYCQNMFWTGLGNRSRGARSWNRRPFLFFLQEPEREPEHFKKLVWSQSWSRSWHKLVRLQAPAEIL